MTKTYIFCRFPLAEEFPEQLFIVFTPTILYIKSSSNIQFHKATHLKQLKLNNNFSCEGTAQIDDERNKLNVKIVKSKPQITDMHRSLICSKLQMPGMLYKMRH